MRWEGQAFSVGRDVPTVGVKFIDDGGEEDGGVWRCEDIDKPATAACSVTGAELDRSRLFDVASETEDEDGSGDLSRAVVDPRAKGLETTTSDDFRDRYRTRGGPLGARSGAEKTSLIVFAIASAGSRPACSDELRGGSEVEESTGDFLKRLARLYLDLTVRMGGPLSSPGSLGFL